MIKQTIILSIVLTLILWTVSVVSDKPKGNPFKIMIIRPKNLKDNQIISDLGQKHSVSNQKIDCKTNLWNFQYFQINFWTDPSRRLRPVTALVREDRNKGFIEALKQKKIEFKLQESDSLLARIQKQMKRMTTSRVGERFDYENRFNSLDEINREMDRLAKDYPNRVSVVSIGMSYENRSIKAIKLIGNKLKNKIVVFECGIHAREWLSQAFCMYAINKLIADHCLLVNYFDFLIIPVLNPDGYVL